MSRRPKGLVRILGIREIARHVRSSFEAHEFDRVSVRFSPNKETFYVTVWTTDSYGFSERLCIRFSQHKSKYRDGLYTNVDISGVQRLSTIDRLLGPVIKRILSEVGE